MRTPQRVSRAELLIVPLEVLAAVDAGVLGRSLTSTLDGSRCRTVTCGAFQILIAAAEPAISNAREMDLIEGAWPEATGFHLAAASSPRGSTWTIESDRYGVRPLYWGLDARHNPIVSTRPDIIAALLGSRLSTLTLTEQLLITFPLESHTIFQGVRRLLPRERLVHTAPDGLSVAQVPPRPCSPAWIDVLGPAIAEAFAEGAALELSGGVDSRLLLALGLRHGVRPQLAVTLGSDADEDVRLARRICATYGIDHVVTPVTPDEADLVADGRRWVERSGFMLNACWYAWFPGVLERLTQLRHTQIGGFGGECGTGFYYSPVDDLVALPGGPRAWVALRYFRRGVDVAALLGRERASHWRREIIRTVLRHLDRTPGSWRRRTNELYLSQRVPNALGTVLSASAGWYLPRHPLLHGAHIEWARSLRRKERTGRRAHRRIIHQLVGDLAVIPFPRAASPVPKLLGRLGGRRAAPNRGAATTAALLFEHDSVVTSLRRLAERDEYRLDPGCIDRMIERPGVFEHELGVLLTTAWAAEAVDALAEDLRAPAIGTMRLAA